MPLTQKINTTRHTCFHLPRKRKLRNLTYADLTPSQAYPKEDVLQALISAFQDLPQQHHALFIAHMAAEAPHIDTTTEGTAAYEQKQATLAATRTHAKTIPNLEHYAVLREEQDAHDLNKGELKKYLVATFAALEPHLDMNITITGWKDCVARINTQGAPNSN